MVKLNLGNWLKPAYVMVNNVGKFEDEGVSVEAFGKPAVQLKINFPNGETKDWTPNYTSMKSLVKAYGEDTKGWVGKPVYFSVTKSNIKGEQKHCITGSNRPEVVQ